MPSGTLLKGSGKSQPSNRMFNDMIFKHSDLTVAAITTKGEDSSEEPEEVGHPSHFVFQPHVSQKNTPNTDLYVRWESNLKPQIF